MTLLQEYNREATRAAILYIAQRTPEPTFHKVSKLLYLADLHYLQEFGMQMFGESYRAMKHGPVPSNAYNEMTAVRRGELADAGYGVAELAVRGSQKAPVIQPLAAPDERQLSLFAKESLDWAIDRFGTWTFDELCAYTHDEMWQRIRAEHPLNDAPPISFEDLAQKALGDDAALALADPFPCDELVVGL